MSAAANNALASSYVSTRKLATIKTFIRALNQIDRSQLANVEYPTVDKPLIHVAVETKFFKLVKISLPVRLDRIFIDS